MQCVIFGRCPFLYTDNAGSTVFLTGEFNGWGQTLMQRFDDHTWSKGVQAYNLLLYFLCTAFSADVSAGPHSFKFIVDGEWKYDPTQVYLRLT